MKGKILLFLFFAFCFFIPNLSYAYIEVPNDIVTIVNNRIIFDYDNTHPFWEMSSMVIIDPSDNNNIVEDLSSANGVFILNQPSGGWYATDDTLTFGFGITRLTGTYGQIRFGNSYGEAVNNPVYILNVQYSNGNVTRVFDVIDTTTRIVSFLPENGTTTSNPIYFELNAYINEDDLGTIEGVSLTFHNIDQNVLILGRLSPNDIYFLDDEDIDTAGDYTFSSTTVIANGNYRVEACIKRSYFGDTFGLIGGWIIDAFSEVNDCQSHQFIVGSSTFIGNLSQNLWSDTQNFFGNSTATSSEALAITCNPLSSQFGIRECMAFLFVPDPNELKITMEEARRAFLSRAPWGYFSRTIQIMSNPATSSLPSFTANIQMGAGSDMTPATTSVTFNIGDMVAGASGLVDGIRDPIHNKSFKDVFEDWIKGGVALVVILTIISDIAMSHRNEVEYSSREKTKLS